jgi:hypothetical protein
VKDLALLLNQIGQPTAAVALVTLHRALFSTAEEENKFDNMMSTFSKRQGSLKTGATHYVRLTNLCGIKTIENIRAMFAKPLRIEEIRIDLEADVAFVKVGSLNAARKTM